MVFLLFPGCGCAHSPCLSQSVLCSFSPFPFCPMRCCSPSHRATTCSGSTDLLFMVHLSGFLKQGWHQTKHQIEICFKTGTGWTVVMPSRSILNRPVSKLIIITDRDLTVQFSQVFQSQWNASVSLWRIVVLINVKVTFALMFLAYFVL